MTAHFLPRLRPCQHHHIISACVLPARLLFVVYWQMPGGSVSCSVRLLRLSPLCWFGAAAFYFMLIGRGLPVAFLIFAPAQFSGGFPDCLFSLLAFFAIPQNRQRSFSAFFKTGPFQFSPNLHALQNQPLQILPGFQNRVFQKLLKTAACKIGRV